MTNAFGRSDLGVVACKHLIDGSRRVRLVTHYTDGDWAFSCGEPDHSEADDGDDYHLIHIEHILSRDSTLKAVADLPRGWTAERGEVGGAWTRYDDPA